MLTVSGENSVQCLEGFWWQNRVCTLKMYLSPFNCFIRGSFMLQSQKIKCLVLSRDSESNGFIFNKKGLLES